MKPCPFCAEEIQDQAIKCRFCNSLLVPIENRVGFDLGKSDDIGKTITYVLDKDLVRFAKFSAAVLAIFIVVGAFLYTVDLKEAAKEIRDSQEEVRKISVSIQNTRAASEQINKESAQLLSEARAQVAQISQSSEEARGIVSAIPRSPIGAEFRSQIAELLTPILNSDQLAKFKANSAKITVPILSISDARRLVQADINKTIAYFSSNGLAPPKIPFEVRDDRNFINAAWNGTQLVYGMGMVNSDLFGPYESGIVIHEATHALLKISFVDQSGGITEHVCDVMAVVIRGGDWTIGKVRSTVPGSAQVLISLAAPETGYASAPSHMRSYAAGMDPHFSKGILNKAAYLMSDGGEFSGVRVSDGIGRDRLGKLYTRVISKLSNRPEWNFREFRELVLTAAAEASFDEKSINAIRNAFAAVGLS